MNETLLLFVVFAYFGLLMLISMFQPKQGGGNDSFFMGNRKSPWFVVAVGMVGASLSGVTFVSVPGMVRDNAMFYMQTVLGFFFGYILIANVLLPLYYRLNTPSIYSYLKERFGVRSYKTGASFFLISKTIGASARLYVVAIILQRFILDAWHVPFAWTVSGIILMIWLYTFRNGIKTIVWTDMLQTICLLTAMILIMIKLAKSMDLNFGETYRALVGSDYFRIVELKDWSSKQHFVKQFISGIFIALVMTGLDQDMMQKNRSIYHLKDAKRNVYTYGFAFVPVNFLFLSMGILLLLYAAQNGIALPESSDDILPVLATQGYMGTAVTLFFMIGIVSAAFSSADSALTALTTSLCVDIFERESDVKFRRWMHALISLLFLLIILVFRAVNNTSLIDAIYVIAGYTYGPLLGLYAFGLFVKQDTDDRKVPYFAVAAPLISYLIQYLSTRYLHYALGYELLMLNGGIMFLCLWCARRKKINTL